MMVIAGLRMECDWIELMIGWMDGRMVIDWMVGWMVATEWLVDEWLRLEWER